jgi:hypothetical protein
MVLIGFKTHEEAVKCVSKEDGKRLGENMGGGFGIGVGVGAEERMRVTLDGQGKVLKAVLRIMQENKAKARDDARKAEKERELAKQRAIEEAKKPQVPVKASEASPAHAISPAPTRLSSRATVVQSRPSGSSTPLASGSGFASTSAPSHHPPPSAAPASAHIPDPTPVFVPTSRPGSTLPPLPRLTHALPARPVIAAPIIVAVNTDKDITAAVRMGGDNPPGEATKPRDLDRDRDRDRDSGVKRPSSSLLKARGTAAPSYYNRASTSASAWVAKAGLPARPMSPVGMDVDMDGDGDEDARGRSTWSVGAGKGIDHWSPGARGREREMSGSMSRGGSRSMSRSRSYRTRDRARSWSRSRSRSHSRSRSWTRSRSRSWSRSRSRARSFSRSRSRSGSWDRRDRGTRDIYVDSYVPGERDRYRDRRESRRDSRYREHDRDRDRDKRRDHDRDRDRDKARDGVGRGGWKAAKQLVQDELAENGWDHVMIDSRKQLVAGVEKEDVHEFFEGFQVDKVCDFVRAHFTILSTK